MAAASYTNVLDALNAIAGDSSQRLSQSAAQLQKAHEYASNQNFGQFIGQTAGSLSGLVPKPLRQVAASVGRGMGALQSMNTAVNQAQQASAQATASGGQVGALTAALAIPGVGEVLAIAGIAVTVVGAIASMPSAIYGWTNSLLDSQKAIARFSPELSSIFLGMEAKEIVRERAFGSATAGSTEGLANSTMAFQDSLLPIRTAVTNIENAVGSKLLDVMNSILKELNKLLPEVKQDDLTDFGKFQKAALFLQGERELGRLLDPNYDPFANR